VQHALPTPGRASRVNPADVELGPSGRVAGFLSFVSMSGLLGHGILANSVSQEPGPIQA